MVAKEEEVAERPCGILYSRRTLSDIVISESVDGERVENCSSMPFTVSILMCSGSRNHRAAKNALPGLGFRGIEAYLATSNTCT